MTNSLNKLTDEMLAEPKRVAAVRAFLEALPREQLVEWLVDFATNPEITRDELCARMDWSIAGPQTTLQRVRADEITNSAILTGAYLVLAKHGFHEEILQSATRLRALAGSPSDDGHLRDALVTGLIDALAAIDWPEERKILWHFDWLQGEEDPDGFEIEDVLDSDHSMGAMSRVADVLVERCAGRTIEHDDQGVLWAVFALQLARRGHEVVALCERTVEQTQDWELLARSLEEVDRNEEARAIYERIGQG
jgi:hypothetical protein